MAARPVGTRVTTLRTLWRVLVLPWQRFPLGMALLVLLVLAGWVAAIHVGGARALGAALVVHGYMLLFIAMMSGMVWASVVRPETQLLPGFRSVLGQLWLIHLIVLVGLPSAFAASQGLPAAAVLAGLLLVFAVSLATGSGAKWAGLVWLTPLLAVVWPELGKLALKSLREGLLLPALIALFSLCILWLVWRRLLAVHDAAPTLSPADLSMTDPRYGPEALQAAQAGPLARWIIARQEALTARVFDRVLRHLAGGRPAADDRALGLVLMPNLHLAGVLVEVLLIALVVVPLIWYFGHRQVPFPAPAIAAYIGLIASLRFQQLHRATLLMRPSLADLYLAMAPGRPAEFTAAVARALRPAIAGAVAMALALALVSAALLPAADRLAWAVGVGIGALAAATFGYGLLLMLLDARRPRLVIGVLLLSFFGSQLTAACAAAFLHSWHGGLLVAVFCLSLTLGFAGRALRQASALPLVFDPPA